MLSLPVLPPDAPVRLTPTDISQFVRVEQCERFLRLRLAERAGQKPTEQYGVTPQRIPPIMSLSGAEFETDTEKALSKTGRAVNFATLGKGKHDRPANNADLLKHLAALKPNETLLLFQTRLEQVLDGWRFRGDVDLLKVSRDADGALGVLVADLKSTAEAKVEHRLQVTFYRLMIEALLAEAKVPHAPVRTGVLFHPPVDPDAEEEEAAAPLSAAAVAEFGLKDVLLEITDDPEAYAQSARDLVLGPKSVARRVAAAEFDSLPFVFGFKCDGCLFTEFCMKRAAEREDLSLLPYLSGGEKEALRRGGVNTVNELAVLKELNGTQLTAAAGHEERVRTLAATWPVGPRLDELIHRAKRFRAVAKKDGTAALPFIPDTGNSTLPACKPDLNPNLVWVYLDAQHDPLEGRVYLLAARVVACAGGERVRSRSVVKLTVGPPDSPAKERALFVGWAKELLTAVVELAEPTEPASGQKDAPVHLVFFDRTEQRALLEGLARNFPPLLDAAPPLYDFLTQLAAFDSPIATFLSDEVRGGKNFPMTCQSLQSLAAFMKFDWSTPHPFREVFRARLFDYLGKIEVEGKEEWYTKRSRFGSSIPAEYAYAAWKALPPVRAKGGDEFADYRAATPELLTAFAARRLEAVEHVARSFHGNPNTTKTAYRLPALAGYDDTARTLAAALDEFVTIERLVDLGGWKTALHAPPERRVLSGDCLLVKYVEADQADGVAEQNREHMERQRKRDEWHAAHPDDDMPKDVKEACKWTSDKMKVTLTLALENVDCPPEQVLALSALRDGETVILFRRWTTDERKPVSERKEFTPTPKQMLYGQRATIISKTAAGVELELTAGRGSKHTLPYAFPSIPRPLDPDAVYTLDPCPDDWYGYFCAKVVEGLKAGGRNTLYSRLESPPPAGDTGGSAGQSQFLAGLVAFREHGFHAFDEHQTAYIGEHARTPLLVVQGPPGTGKSYSTAFAVFARIQGAMHAGQPCRAFVSCKTHAATDVLMVNVLKVQGILREWKKSHPKLFAKHFDPRLLDVPLYRVAPKEPPPDGITELTKEKEKGEPKNADLITADEWAVVGVTPGGTYRMLKDRWPKNLFGHDLCDLLVLDEASQMNLPEAAMAALPLKPDAPLVVVGDHRQMPPIVKHDWDAEARRTFRRYQVYRSLFDTLLSHDPPPPVIRFAESFRLHAGMAEFLRREVYRRDNIHYHSKKREVLPAVDVADPFAAAVLRPDFPLVVVVHDECGSQVENAYEQRLIAPVLAALAGPHALDATHGLGVVVPHRAQRAALKLEHGEAVMVDTVERYQGSERTAVLVSATESDRAYLLASAGFLLDPRRLTVAMSRAKRKAVLVAGRGVFELFSPDAEQFENALLWKNLLLRTCTTLLWEGDRDGTPVQVWGGGA